ncbi:MAG: hypothetical protein IT383_05800 [Deltaproteobacteria bacterium]|nr:hypothetical protein [Deltaproteobacteria bacterium]
MTAKNLPCLALSTLLATLLSAAGAAATPQTVVWSAQVENDGGPVDGTVSLSLSLFDAPNGGALVHEESVPSAAVVDGVLVHELGAAAGNPLDSAVLDHPALFLQVTINGETLSPRLPIRSVPYALRAEQCTSLEGLSADDVATDDEVASALASVSVPFSSITGLPPWLADGELTATPGGGLQVVGNGIGIAAGSITRPMLANGAIDGSKLEPGAVVRSAIAADAVGSGEIADAAITSADIADGAITGDDIANGTVRDSDVAGVSVYLFHASCSATGLTLDGSCGSSSCPHGTCSNTYIGKLVK